MKKQEQYRAFVVVDLETGGLSHQKNPIIEIACIPVLYEMKRQRYVIQEDLGFESIILPYDKSLVIEDAALAHNKMTMKQILQRGNKATKVIEVFDAMIEELNPQKNDRYKPILVGHNIANFDLLFLQQFFKFHSNSLYSRVDRSMIDTLTMAQIMFSGNTMIDNIRLETVCSYFGIRLINAHRAKADALVTAQLFVKFSNFINAKRNRSDLLKL